VAVVDDSLGWLVEVLMAELQEEGRMRPVADMKVVRKMENERKRTSMAVVLDPHTSAQYTLARASLHRESWAVWPFWWIAPWALVVGVAPCEWRGLRARILVVSASPTEAMADRHNGNAVGWKGSGLTPKGSPTVLWLSVLSQRSPYIGNARVGQCLSSVTWTHFGA
jgi:hypothetical protein